MKIKSSGEVSAIRLKHSGAEMSLEHIIPKKFGGELRFVEPTNIAIFEFKDLCEVETMINMLESFREELYSDIGRWTHVRQENN